MRLLEAQDTGEYPEWMSERVRQACAKYPNFSGEFIQEMEDAQLNSSTIISCAASSLNEFLASEWHIASLPTEAWTLQAQLFMRIRPLGSFWYRMSRCTSTPMAS